MSEEFREQLDRVRAWAARASSEDWLTEQDTRRLDAIETGSADELFEDRERRPLVVGFFGGTGVGKSTLLNRLAGLPIARVGVRRPTSTEATMYVHRAQTLQAFPEGSPVEDTRVEYHDVDSRRDVAWLDMPDIDSVESRNRQLVLAWLPYVDWLVYVVSPERYRDDVGWKLLQRRQRKHHWLFVVNRWDEAVDSQLEEFAADLLAAGFDEPQILRTSSVDGVEDDFGRLEEIIEAAIRRHGLEELKRIGVLARLDELQRVAEDMRRRLGAGHDWIGRHERLAEVLDPRFDVLERRVAAELNYVVQRYPARPAFWRPDPAPPAIPDEALSRTIDSAYTSDLVGDAAMALAAKIEDAGVRSGPYREGLRGVLDDAGALILSEVRNALADAVEAPDGTARRTARRVADVMSYVLPVSTGVWVAWTLAVRYLQGISGGGAFLGIDFAVHSLLMIGLSWFVPFLASRWLRPSLRRAAQRGMHTGVERAVRKLKAALIQALERVCAQRKALLESFPSIRHRGIRE